MRALCKLSRDGLTSISLASRYIILLNIRDKELYWVLSYPARNGSEDPLIVCKSLTNRPDGYILLKAILLFRKVENYSLQLMLYSGIVYSFQDGEIAVRSIQMPLPEGTENPVK